MAQTNRTSARREYRQRSQAMLQAFEQATGGGAPQPAESTASVRRIAADGHAYTWEHFVEEYGADAQRFWDDASQLAENANAEPQPTPAIDEEDAAANQMPSIPEERRANQWNGCSSCDDSDASQPAVNATSDGQPQPVPYKHPTPPPLEPH